MANTAANVRVGVTGGVFFAPAGTALPTDATTAKNVAFVDHGFVSDEGVAENIGDSTTTLTAWQNATVVRKITTETDVTYSFNALETNAVSLASYYGNYAAGVVNVVGGAANRRGSWVVEVTDGAALRRIVIPDGQVTERGEVSFVNGDAVMYPITITCYPDASGHYARHYFSPAPS